MSVKRYFHRKPYMIAVVIMVICLVMLFWLNVIAYAQGAAETPVPPSQIETFFKYCAYVGLSLSGLTFTVKQIHAIWRQYRYQEEKETGETWKKLADSRKEELAETKLELSELKNSRDTYKARTIKQKKLILRLISKLEGEGMDFDEESEDL